MKALGFALLVSLFLAGCSASPSSTVENIRKMASDGNIQGVLACFDKQKINDDLTRQVVKSMEYDDAIPYKDFAIRKFKLEADDIFKTRVWDIIEDEVKKGKGGSLAKLQIIKEDKSNKHNAKVQIQLGNGKRTTLTLFKVEDKWLVTGLDADDAFKSKIFKNLSAKPSFSKNKIKMVKKYVGKNPDAKFYEIIGVELRTLLGKNFDRLTGNLAVSEPIQRDGPYIVLSGMAPEGKDREEAIIVIDCDNGILNAAMLTDGKAVTRFSDIPDRYDYPDLLKRWHN
jgi:hypothetical protein